MSRRRFLALGGAGLGAALLGGCGRPRGKGPVEIVFSHGEDTPVLRSQVSRFNAERKGRVQVRLTIAPSDTGQYFEMLRTGFEAEEVEADVISGDVIWPAQFAANGWISDLSGLFPASLRERNLPATIRSNTHDGGVYGVPWFTDAGMLFFRSDLLEGSGFSEPPATWDELKEMVAKIRRDEGTRFGYVFQGAEYEGGVVNGLEFIWNAGGDVLEGDLDEPAVAGPRSVEGLQAARGMVESGVSPEAVASFKEYESYTVFLAGEAVFMRNWPNVYSRAADPSRSAVEPERIGVAPLPTARPEDRSYSGLGGWNLMLNASSEEKREAAWEFVRYLTAPEQQKERALEGGFLPTLKACYEDAEILSKVPVIALGKEAIRNVRSRPATPFYHDMSLAMARRFHESLSGMESPQAAAQALERDLEGILSRAEGT